MKERTTEEKVALLRAEVRWLRDRIDEFRDVLNKVRDVVAKVEDESDELFMDYLEDKKFGLHGTDRLR